jgi:hypothetical protein
MEVLTHLITALKDIAAVSIALSILNAVEQEFLLAATSERSRIGIC